MNNSNLAKTLERMCRFGYAAKGVTYGLVGVLALRAAIFSGGQLTGSKGALAMLVGEGIAGRVLLGLIGGGLASYSLWQFTRVTFDPEGEGDDAKGIFKRAFFALSGVLLASVAIYAITMAVRGFGSGSSGGGSRGVVQTVLSWPGGQWIVGAIGAGIAGYGLFQVWRGWTANFRKDLDLSRLTQRTRDWVVRVSRFGYGARGVVFGVVGWLFVQAALANSSSEAGGVSKALHELDAAGPWVLTVVAAGLLAYGIATLLRGFFRKVRIDPDALPV